MPDPRVQFVSRGGDKLADALAAFAVQPAGQVCADLGSNAGGFVDCLLRHGAARVYAVERGYGVLDYRLRTDPRVHVLERTDALRLRLREPVALITIDVGWTRQAQVLPVAARLLTPEGRIVSLVKPHYEAEPRLLKRGVLPPERIGGTLTGLRERLAALGVRLLGEHESPLPGRGGNREVFWYLAKR